MTSQLMTAKNWKNTFNFKGKEITYNRIKFNNPSERAVEVPIAFDFLASVKQKKRVLEVGNVLANYENTLSQLLGIDARKIIDKFEVDANVDNEDLMELSSEEKYDVIVSVSTVEHIGQGVDPSLDYGDRAEKRDLEAPLKAIVKIYELLAVNGKALITTNFGTLTDGGWYIQPSPDYLELLVEKLKIPQDAISLSFLKLIDRETTGNNFQMQWIESELSAVQSAEYNSPFSGANAIAVIELSKVSEEFQANLDSPPTPFYYNKPCFVRSVIQPLKFLQETETLDDEEFFHALYHSYLKRKPDEEGKKTFFNSIRNGTFSRKKAIADVRNSQEYKSQWEFWAGEPATEIISIDIPKTVGTKFLQVLEKVYGSEEIFLDYPSLPESKGKMPEDRKAVHGDFPVNKYSDFFYRYAAKIIWLKHPIIRLISAYEDCLQKNESPTKASLLEYADNPQNQNIVPGYIQGLKLTNFYFVGISEFFREDLRELQSVLGLPEIKVDCDRDRNKPDRQAFTEEVFGDRQLMKRLVKLNERDLEIYQQALEIRANRQKKSGRVQQFQNYLEKYQSRLEKFQSKLIPLDTATK